MDLGTDFWCDNDILPTLQQVSGTLCVAQALYRRLTTRREGLWYDLDYGTDLRDFLNQSGVTAFQVEAAIQQECLKDERVASVTATITIEGVGTTRIVAELHVETYGDQEFEFTTDVSNLKAEMLDFREAA